MPEESLTENHFEDATIGMNIPKNFIPSIEKVIMMSVYTFVSVHGPKQVEQFSLKWSFSNYVAQLTCGTICLKN